MNNRLNTTQAARRRRVDWKRPSITEQAGISKPDSPPFSAEVLKALNVVLGSR